MSRRLVSALAVALLLAAGGCSSGPQPGPVPVPVQAQAPASWACADPVNSALPDWAGAQFIHPSDPVPHLLGADGIIVAVPFGWPLRERQPAGHSNKILWVAKSGSGPLQIVATEQASAQTVTRDLAGGPGPSIVDLPRAGCWRFDLRWADQHDEVFLRYAGPAA